MLKRGWSFNINNKRKLECFKNRYHVQLKLDSEIQLSSQTLVCAILPKTMTFSQPNQFVFVPGRLGKIDVNSKSEIKR